MTKIIPGIHQLRLPIPNNPLGYTNIYLLRGNDKHLLIDTGVNTDEALQSLKKQLAEIGVAPQDIAQIVVTHAHGDHYGLAGELKRLSGAKIFLHQHEQSVIYPDDTDMADLRHQTEQWLYLNGAPPNMLPPYLALRRLGPLLPPDTTLRGGETVSSGIFNLQVLWTPGHSPGHVCLYEPEQKLLFTGDHILPVITPNVSFQPQSSINPLGDFLNSLRMVKGLDVRLALPAHEHLFTDLPKRVDEIIEHHEQRSAEVLETTRSEPKTAYQISTVVTWMPELGGVRFQDLAPWDKRMAVAETLAHLEAMRFERKVDKFTRDGVVYYKVN